MKSYGQEEAIRYKYFRFAQMYRNYLFEVTKNLLELMRKMLSLMIEWVCYLKSVLTGLHTKALQASM